MKVELLNITADSEKLIEKAARNCYQSAASETDERRSAFISGLIKSGHLSVLEHASATFELKEVSRALLAQITRHRVASYSVKSQRYCDERDVEYIIPKSIDNNEKAREIYLTCLARINSCYEDLRELSIPKEDARFILPNSAETDIVMTANFREWLHIIELRTSPKAQWEIRECVGEIERILKENAPSVFGV